jgi:hypothetical protein
MAVSSRLPVFLLQIVDATSPWEVVRIPAGGTLERDLTSAIAREILQVSGPALRDHVRDAILARGVGLFRTEAHVSADIDAALHALPTSQIEALVTTAISGVFSALKRESVRAL